MSEKTITTESRYKSALEKILVLDTRYTDAAGTPEQPIKFVRSIGRFGSIAHEALRDD
jgi:hypothetical protein